MINWYDKIVKTAAPYNQTKLRDYMFKALYCHNYAAHLQPHDLNYPVGQDSQTIWKRKELKKTLQQFKEKVQSSDSLKHQLQQYIQIFKEDQIRPNDPNGDWLLNQLANGESDSQDIMQLQQTIKDFNRVKAKLQQKDLNQYKNFAQLKMAVDSVTGSVGKTVNPKLLADHFTLIAKQGPYSLYKANDVEGVKQIGQISGSWCTRGSYGEECRAQTYFQHGIYQVLKGDQLFAQSDGQLDQITDLNNNRILNFDQDLKLLLKHLPVSLINYIKKVNPNMQLSQEDKQLIIHQIHQAISRSTDPIQYIRQTKLLLKNNGLNIDYTMFTQQILNSVCLQIELGNRYVIGNTSFQYAVAINKDQVATSIKKMLDKQFKQQVYLHRIVQVFDNLKVYQQLGINIKDYKPQLMQMLKRTFSKGFISQLKYLAQIPEAGIRVQQLMPFIQQAVVIAYNKPNSDFSYTIKDIRRFPPLLQNKVITDTIQKYLARFPQHRILLEKYKPQTVLTLASNWYTIKVAEELPPMTDQEVLQSIRKKKQGKLPQQTFQMPKTCIINKVVQNNIVQLHASLKVMLPSQKYRHYYSLVQTMIGITSTGQKIQVFPVYNMRDTFKDVSDCITTLCAKSGLTSDKIKIIELRKK